MHLMVLRDVVFKPCFVSFSYRDTALAQNTPDGVWGEEVGQHPAKVGRFLQIKEFYFFD